MLGGEVFSLFILVVWINEALFWIIYVDHQSVCPSTSDRFRALMICTHVMPIVVIIVLLVLLDVSLASAWWIMLACMRVLAETTFLSVLIIKNKIY